MELKHLPGIDIVGAKKIWLCIVGMQMHNTRRFGPKQSILAEEVDPPQAEMSPNWTTNKIKCKLNLNVMKLVNSYPHKTNTDYILYSNLYECDANEGG